MAALVGLKLDATILAHPWSLLLQNGIMPWSVHSSKLNFKIAEACCESMPIVNKELPQLESISSCVSGLSYASNEHAFVSSNGQRFVEKMLKLDTATAEAPAVTEEDGM